MAVRDEHDRAPLHDGAQGVVDGLLGPGVDRARRIVEHEDPGVAQDGACQRDALPLPAGQAQAALADDRVVAPREGHHEVVGLGGARGRLDLVVRGIRCAVGDVVAHRLGEQERVLERHPDRASQR